MTDTARLEVGDTAPAFNLTADDGNTVKLSDYKGRKVIVYFYPAALTRVAPNKPAASVTDWPNSTTPGSTWSGSAGQAEKLAKFRDAEGLTFPLLSDPERKVLTAWGAFGEKKMYGKTVQGVIRSTFLVDEKARSRSPTTTSRLPLRPR